MTSQNTGPDPVLELYDRAVKTVYTLKDETKIYDPFEPNDKTKKTNALRWGQIKSKLDCYRFLLSHLDNTLKRMGEIQQSEVIARAIHRTRAIQFRNPSIDDARNRFLGCRRFCLDAIDELATTEGRKTLNAYHLKVERFEKTWNRHQGVFDGLDELVENLRNEFALIDKDLAPSLGNATTTPLTQTQSEQGNKGKPNAKPGRPFEKWEKSEKEIWRLWNDGMKPQDIADKLDKPPTEINSKLNALKRRVNRGNTPEK